MKKRTPIAVAGMAGIFPGAHDLNIFWQNIINKVDTTSEVLADRWIVEPNLMYYPAYTPDKAISKRCCLITDFKFDPNGINIDSDLLKELDPLYHLVLQAGREALQSCKTSSLNKERIGTVLAAIALPTDASSFITREILGKSLEAKLFDDASFSGAKPLTKKQCLAARVTSLPAAILAAGLGLGGGSYTLDAACASSLYAVKLACDELRSGRADAMLAGGVSRPECLYTQVGFSQLRALSPSGRCAPFDESADGLVVGEGVGILVLKRLEDALRDGDNIYGLIRSIGLSNDMRGNLVAPDSEGQVRAMRSAYEFAGWSPGDIDLIECHGAGTPVGDTTELYSLRKIWGESGWSGGQCAIGSVKSMIGHLLTAAGAAGMIKTLLALKHKILPPSLNYHKAPAQSPLHNSPFRVQTDPQKWPARGNHASRRAAVSAFGFGGINAHLLLEEWNPEIAQSSKLKAQKKKQRAEDFHLSVHNNPQPDIAIVGMEAVFGRLNSLKDFQETVFKGDSIIEKRPEHRWKGCDKVAASHLDGHAEYGGFMNELLLDIGKFHIPPREIPDIIIQHLLMLKVSAGAIKDAGLPLRKKRPWMGVVIGINFDFEATNFNLRWNLPNEAKKWKEKIWPALDENEMNKWLESLKDSCNPPLTNTRTLGALGGIIASRIAREFQFGGPSFVVSGEESSGLRALEIGIRSLQQNETDAMLVGAVDLFGDVRSVIISDQIKPFSNGQNVRPFDSLADGTLPGEGAVALVLKRLDRAIKDRDRIYSVIKGIGSAGGGGIVTGLPSKEAYILSLKRSFEDAGISPSSISYLETHGSGHPLEDNIESEALNEFFAGNSEGCAIGSVKANIGHTGAVAGLASVVKTSLCLYQEIIPPLKNFVKPKNSTWQRSRFHLPSHPQYWLRNRKDGPRRACTGCMTSDGNCMHVILESFEYSSPDQVAGKVLKTIEQERKQPLGLQDSGLFVVEGNSKKELIDGLDALDRYLKEAADVHQNIELKARAWHQANGLIPSKKYAVSLVANNISQLEKSIIEAKNVVSADTSRRLTARGNINFSPEPLGRTGEIAFVFPGSGNHYLGMGRGIGIQWPEVLRDLDLKTGQLKTQFVPDCFIPWRSSWTPGWEKEAAEKIISDPINMILGQIVHGCVVTNLVKRFGIKPSAVIGYSLGELAGLFALEAWPDRGEMLVRMRQTNLFSTELAGPCNAARKAWNIPAGEEVNWCVAVVNRPADLVRKVINKLPSAKLLIINTYNQCVIGGRKNQVEVTINMLDCEAVFLEGVVTVHCDAAGPVADEYKKLHIFPVTPPDGIRFYSCALGRSYDLTSESAASSIQQQAVSGFDFTTTVEQAYRDGIRIFLEMGPHSSCTTMINSILETKPHLSVSACVRGEDDYLTILKLLGSLIAERVPVDLDKLYGRASAAREVREHHQEQSPRMVTLIVGGKAPSPSLPPKPSKVDRFKPPVQRSTAISKIDPQNFEDSIKELKSDPFLELIKYLKKNIEATSNAHKTFLQFSNDLTRSYAGTFAFQNQLLETIILNKVSGLETNNFSHRKPAFSREMCLEFATGSVAKVLGPEFAIVDTYKARVRLPDEPLMLVDRIISVEGKKGSLGSGRIVTEHDVLPGAWYLDGGRAPVCISVEAGQADLFLCSYLGIDLAVKGERTYRLLDATVKFHRGLPQPGDVIRYEIEIEKFVRQQDTYLFFFNFEGFIGNDHLISMTNGCAGFFTKAEMQSSGGIILTDEDTEPLEGKKSNDWQDLVPVATESYSDDALDALRKGNLAECFGALFDGIGLAESLRLPGGRMRLIDRILLLDPNGGRYGLGLIRAEADIHPDDWFLTCHFMDDMVMPGTLMYECCAHTLRVFIQRIGWVTEKPDVCYEPLVGVKSVLKCRGPVTPETKQVIYEVEIKEIGYDPEPYVIADANMYADGQHIVMFKDMSLKMTGITRAEIESGWRKEVLFDRNRILTFATGKPSEAFGEPYQEFDEGRFIARLPGPPYSFIDRIISSEPEAWTLEPDGWIEAEYDVPPDAWYFKANRSSSMPYCVLNEIALQPCGWLAAYAGSALRSKKDLKFRNLGGQAVLHNEILSDAGRLTTRVRLTNVSEAGDMIIENFDFEVLHQGRPVYSGNTYFGFFTDQALANQVGIQDAAKWAYLPASDELKTAKTYMFEDEAPLTPDDHNIDPAHWPTMPAKALRMIDNIEISLSDGGPEGLGFIRGLKRVDPAEWFFKAHFYQDPVMPGSLGLESLIQLIKFMALDRWKDLANSYRIELLTEKPHSWTYRGQVLPENKTIEVEAVITDIQNTPVPTIQANGFLKVDGLYIYEMKNFGLRLIGK